MVWLVCVASLSALAFIPANASASNQLFSSSRFSQVIGSVGFDGLNPQPNFIANEPSVEGMVVSGEYLYWESSTPKVQIGRSRTDGTEVNPEFLNAPGGPAGEGGMSISNGRLYWIETRSPEGYGPTVLSSANLDGSDPEYQFLALPGGGPAR